ncbi:aldo/keto reductase [Sphingobacterium thalpophilum]|uniref:Putative oxidoreductase n=1 Tax=Sphingobacterium thalpophilum TaxID=259 RepID=A0A4U9U8R0_9SPHI|nr:aldo/keto reductase [Sphingobacterium thalpophilum]VTR29366.1 putative oxidoreductase [Sphingobacterium thalpophilum]
MEKYKRTDETDAANGRSNINRRDFLTKTALAGTGLVMAQFAWASAAGKPLQAAEPFVKGKRMLGALEVSEIGLGCMSMAGVYNPVQPKAEMIALLHKAVDRGVTFFDTAEVYGPHISEEYVGEGLASFKGKVQIATKFGWNTEGGKRGGRLATPEHIRKVVDQSLKRLRVEAIDLYYLHRIDPNVPVEDVAGTVKELVQAGKVKHFGLSEVSPDTIRKAHAIQPVAAVQSEYSLLERAVENGVISTCEELGIGFVPWGPTARGFLTGLYDENSKFDESNRRGSVSYFAPEVLKFNMPLLTLVRDWAKRKGCTPVQFSLAWLMAQKPFIVPIPGTVNPKHFIENIGAVDVRLTAAEITEIRAAITKIPLQGVRSPQSALSDQ